MPASGGTADKLGNRYEALWAIDELLKIIDGTARELALEPLNPDESRGIEFRVANADGTIDYWSVKRQTTKGEGWSLHLLGLPDGRGRSILGDLLGHVEKNPVHRGVFASALGARDFVELCDSAPSSDTFNARLDRSKELKADFRDYLLQPLCGGDVKRALAFLLRARAKASDETELRDRVDFAIRKLLFVPDGRPLDTTLVRGFLGDLLLDNINRPLRQDAILRALGQHGIGRRDWAIERTVLDQIAALCESYTKPLSEQFINKTFLQLAGSEAVLGPKGMPVKPKVLVVGGAGGGKSCTLSAAVAQLRNAGVPVLPIRFDLLQEGILTTTELGRKLQLPESPAVVLAGVAQGGPCVLVVDQLDAVSMASGRRTEVWSLFDYLRREIEQYPNMSLLVGCRKFDLENDHRIRGLKARGSGFTIAELKPLSTEQVDEALREAKIAPVQGALKKLLEVPLHLSMYLGLPETARVGMGGRDELFDCFWQEKERQTNKVLGRKAAWPQVMDKLSDWLSENQQLAAPKHVLDDYCQDAEVMASEHVLILADECYQFFHESFFDYAYARRFATGGGRLVDLLLGGAQHLFRRAQVRQILTYLRANAWQRYLGELESVLTTADIRFHIKRLVFQWMSSLPDPRQEEWDVLQRFAGSDRGLRSHVRSVIAGQPAWFDVLDTAGFLDAALSSGDAAREQEVIWLLGLSHIRENRSARIATLLREHRKAGELWNQYLRHLCRFGDVYHSPEMFDLFLSLIEDGTLDGLRPGVAVNDDWWSALYHICHERPELGCEVIGRWFDRALVTWQAVKGKAAAADKEPPRESRFSEHLDRSGDGAHVILMAAKAPRSYAQSILPRLARLVNETAKECRDRLHIDPVWSFRMFGDNSHQVHSALLYCLAKSLEELAKKEPAELDRLLTPFADRPQDTIAYLALRAWTAAPDTYANKLADYLVVDPRRLKVGYAAWSGSGGSAANYVSSQAVKAASLRCAPERLAKLEAAIVNLTDELEAKHPRGRGLMQLELLQSVDPSRMSAVGRAKSEELRAKFPNFEQAEPEDLEARMVGSPISGDAQAQMSDEQWLGAMRKYAGVSQRFDRPTEMSGGEHELAGSVQYKTKADPVRFANLACRMPDDLPESYFGAILRGVAECVPQEGGAPPITFDQVVSLVRRVHKLPRHPCGQWIAYLVGKWIVHHWPDDIIEAVAWYAMNDPDPERELWSTKATSGEPYHGGDPYSAGINSTRGAIALLIAQLLFDKPERIQRLREAAQSLASDRSIAVRSCAVAALLAVMNIDLDTATRWFTDCVAADSALLRTPHVENFLYYAGRRKYAAIRSVVETMLGSSDLKVVEAASRQVCRLALTVEEAGIDAGRVREGTPAMRKAAVDVYSTNVPEATVGPTCRQFLKPFFADADESVRAEAASAFQHISQLSSASQEELLSAFLDGNPGPKALEPVVRALEDSPVQLPDLVCRLAEKCAEAFRAEGGDIRTTGAMVAMDLSKIVIRLYTQTEDRAIKTRCLNLIDEMELNHFMGLSDELGKLDR